MRLATVLSALVTVLPAVVSAHPGHDHSDIPAVLRHPFASVEHFGAAAAVTLATVGAIVLLRRSLGTRRAVPARR